MRGSMKRQGPWVLWAFFAVLLACPNESGAVGQPLDETGARAPIGVFDSGVGGLLLDGGALNDAATAPFATDGKVVFAQGAKLTLAGQRKFRSNRAPVTVATAAGGFEGTIEVADPLPGREYRLYVDGTALKLECQCGMAILVR